MNKSPINFLGGLAAGALIGRRGKKKTARALGKIDKRLSSIESKIDSASGAQQGAVPEIDASMDAVDSSVIENSGSGGGEAITGPDMNGGVEPVPGGVDTIDEDSFATAGDSGLNMIRGILKRNK
jgi:hypothetical protein